jgi:glycosyltransferase involved in cell wall biosynthesis
VLFGPPGNINMLLRGAHRRNFVMLAPNSSWIPDNVVRSAKAIDAELQKRGSQLDFVAPSEWGAQQLRRHWHRPVNVWRHGMSPAFQRNEFQQSWLWRVYGLRGGTGAMDGEGTFNVLHLSSSAGQRKGTAELFSAWEPFQDACQQASVMHEPKLTVIVEPGRHHQDVLDLAASFGSPKSIQVLTRLDYTDEQMAKFYQQHHVVCQPSRGEGFGLVPLEARACGVPVVMTDCTGHGEHACLLHGDPEPPKCFESGVNPYPGGTVVVKTGELAPIDDGPGARAPSLKAQHVCDALLEALLDWPRLSEEAKLVSTILRGDQSAWSWRATTAEWLKTIEVEDE